MTSLLKTIRHGLPRFLHDFLEQRSRRIIQSSPLWNLLDPYLKRSSSTRCSYSDYLLLYNFVRNQKPREILECGTGASTIVMAHALKENEKEYGIRGRVTSMEESEEYYQTAVKLLPESIKDYAEIVLSPALEDTYEFFRGVRYRDIPDRPYDFVFVDGPSYLTDPGGDILAFDFDLISVVKKSGKPVSALIDTRTSTCFVYSLLFGDKFKYDYIRKVGIVEPCTKSDLLSAKAIVARAMKKHAFRRPSLLKCIRASYP